MSRVLPKMRPRLKALLVVGTAFAAVTCHLVVLPYLNPLRRSADSISAFLLERVPPGTSREEVCAIIRERGWTGGGIVGAAKDGDISSCLGTYQDIPFRINVYALWQFDHGGRLLSIQVDKVAINAL